MGRMPSDDVEVIWRTIILVVLGTLYELLVVHLPKIYCLDRVSGIKGIRDPIVAIVISMACYLHFVSYMLELTTLRAVGLQWWRLSSCVLSYVTSSVLLLGASSVGGVVFCIARGVTSGVSSLIGCCVGSDVGSVVGRLRDFIVASSLFSHELNGGIVVASLTKSLRPTPGVGA
jgi:hypothetical protein